MQIKIRKDTERVWYLAGLFIFLGFLITKIKVELVFNRIPDETFDFLMNNFFIYLGIIIILGGLRLIISTLEVK